ncbi:hypothetical protein HK098_005800 [Nowakowskiella sp. JEL0407]|nr:hypothetical protein HK098_005800 [Nowakowskiella sp. JEL0407]
MFRHRLSTYKNHNELQPDELRRRRENTADLVQKRNREILISTLRLQDKTYLKEIEKEENIAELPDLTKIICFGTFEEQFIATRTLRRFAYKEDGPIHEIIECGLLPLIVERLSSASYKIQYQSAWTLSNIAAEGSKQALDVIKSGAVPILIRLLQSPNDEVKEHVLWALGNVAGHSSSPDNRDFVISHGVFPPLLEIINNSKR